MSCKEVPIRIWILLLMLTTRFLMTSISQMMSFCWHYMIEKSNKVRYKPWCLLTSQQKLEAAQIPWYNYSSSKYGPREKWPHDHYRRITDAMFYGQVISSVPGGILAEYVGPFYALLYSTSMAAIFNIGRAIITAARWKNLVVVEFFLGIHLGLVFPAIYTWIARWAPPNERGLFVASHVGDGFGYILTRLFVRYMIPAIGWEWVFYSFTLLTILYLMPLLFIGSNNPEDNKWISAKELLYIKRSQRGKVTPTRSFPPYGKMLSSGAFWSLSILYFGTTNSYFFFLFEVTNFLYKYMGIPMDVVDILDVFPHLGFSSMAVVAAFFADFVRTKKVMAETTTIKIMILFSHLGPGCILLFMGVAYCNPKIPIVLLFVGYTSSGCSTISCYRTIIDLCPNYAGAAYGLLRISGYLAKIAVPKLTKEIFLFNSGIIGWTIIFLIGGGCLIGTAVIFLFFGTADTQWWNLKSQDVYKFSHYKKPETRPPLEGGVNTAGASRTQNEREESDLFEKGIDVNTEDWKPMKGKASGQTVDEKQSKTISSRASEYKRIKDADSVFERPENRSPTKTRDKLSESEGKESLSRADVRISSNNTVPIAFGNIVYSSEYSKGLSELGERMNTKSTTRIPRGIHTYFKLGKSLNMDGITQKGFNYFDKLAQERSKSSPDLRWMNCGETDIRKK